jgi:hypothetical protein
MQVSLWADPAYESIAPLEVKAGVERLSATVLRFHYVVTGRMDGLLLPPPSPSRRADNLWRTTCFEAFLAPPDVTSYVELNFSPSSQWAAYEFRAYRQGMAQAGIPGPPDIEVVRCPDRLELTATISLDVAVEKCRLNLCAVIEEAGGVLSYWAMGHAPGSPDFHHRNCFALELPAPEPA